MGSHISFPISFIYGEQDWMCSRGSRQVVRANRHFREGTCQLHILKNEDHHLMNDPASLCRLHIDDCFDLVTRKYETMDYKIYFEDSEGDFINDNDELRVVEYSDYNEAMPNEEIKLEGSPIGKFIKTL